MDISCTTLSSWKSALSSYDISLESLYKPDLIPLDAFYRKELPLLIQQREPHPFVTQPELRRLLQWKLSRGKWRPRLLEFVSSLSETLVESASKRAFASLPDLTKAVSELTILKGVGPATASAVLAAYAPEVAPFMSDEAMVATLGNAKEYTLKKYISFAEILQKKAKDPKMSVKLHPFMDNILGVALRCPRYELLIHPITGKLRSLCMLRS
ncbi:uncharacterized protein LOC110032029 isoform X2 [Phalaenopsis equestris]|uniref:uncharacterized protein LOC110032029 isoform X2 n=1 Tax=Phalaenopsis equestris TaxID=78828 RepID=UPI0009E40167|nr:uncharacterized protein LOC110032029 isoform X2 [Phalaenopsis equestris]